MTLTPHTFVQGDVTPIVSTVLFGEQEFILADSRVNNVPEVVAPVAFKGATPLVDQIAAVANESVLLPVVAPTVKDSFNPDTVFHTAIVRTDPFVALTPAEIELNREIAYTSTTPVLASK